ncbi:MAG: class I SAM-dependent methyltransferase [Chloroflexi bacterium]|nr:class I SAM-dependent methyltransferase [Chloroflexota bacterium]
MSAKHPLEPTPPERWRKYLTDYNEGLGLVYERLMLNDFLDSLQKKHHIESVLEAPIYGMAGVSGINSVLLARNGARVTLVDDNAERLAGVQRIWNELGLAATFHLQSFDFAQDKSPISSLPLPGRSFDLVWNWAALWYLPDPEKWIGEMVRVSRNLVFIAMPNRAQVGYLMRKYVLEKDFVRYVDESWANIGRVKTILRDWDCKIINEGVLDVPPWPDTVMPAAQVLKRLGIQSKEMSARFEGDGWQWSSMDYYLGKKPELKAQMDRYAFLERAPVPWQIKSVWAHHRYVVASVS